MPQHTATGLDVSAEEERYLRRAFRRFALPYLVLGLALVAWFAWGSGADDGSPAELEALRAELTGLRGTLEALDSRVSEAGSRAAQAARIAGELREGDAQQASSSEVAALQRELRGAASRIAALERQLGEQPVGQRFDALRDRIAGVEERLGAGALPAAPAPGGFVPPAP